MEISDNLIVTHGEVSFNKLLKVPDASFNNIGSLGDDALQIVTDASFQSNVEISNNLIVTHGEVSFNKLLKVPDASFNNIGSLGDDALQIVTDASFQSNVEISDNLIVTYGEVSFNKLLKVPDASFENVGSLGEKELQIVSDASFQRNVEISDNLIVTHGEVSFNKLLKVPDASFNNIGSLGDDALQIVTDASFQSNVEISNNLIVTHGEVSFNKLLKVPDASFENVGSLGEKELQIVSDASFQRNVEISDNLIVTHGEVSFNKLLKVPDASFNNIGSLGDDALQIVTDASFQSNVEISNNLIVTHGEVSFNKLLKVPDASFNNIGNLNGSSLQINTDVSFNNNVNIFGNLTIDGSFSFSEVIQNITTISNEILISTQLDICNQGTGPALEVTQIGTGATHDIALFNSDPDVKAFEIKHDGKSIFYNDVSFNTKLIVPDASFNNIGSLDGKELQIVTDASFQNKVDISNDLFVGQDVSINRHLTVPDASFVNISVSHIYGNSPINLMHSTDFHEKTSFLKNVDICNGGILNVSDISLNNIGALDNNNIKIVSDASFMNNVDICNNLSCKDITFSGKITNNNGEEVGASLNVELVDINGTPDLSFSKISLLKFNKDSGFDISDQGIADASSVTISLSSHWKEFDSSSAGGIGTGDVIPSGQEKLTFIAGNNIILDLCNNNYAKDEQTFKIETASDVSFNIIEEFTPGAGITFLNDVSINTHLTVPDASINRIAPIDGSLIIMGDLSVNGSVVSNDGELGFAGTWKITANGSSSYRFTGNGLNGTQDNPTLFLIRGSKYKFNNISGGHVIGLRDNNNSVLQRVDLMELYLKYHKMLPTN